MTRKTDTKKWPGGNTLQNSGKRLWPRLRRPAYRTPPGDLDCITRNSMSGSPIQGRSVTRANGAEPCDSECPTEALAHG